jgi:hypothetical protein
MIVISILFSIASLMAGSYIFFQAPQLIPSMVFATCIVAAGLALGFFFLERRLHLALTDILNDLKETHLKMRGVLDTVTKVDNDVASVEKEFARITAKLDEDELSKLLDRVGTLEMAQGFTSRRVKRSE